MYESQSEPPPQAARVPQLEAKGWSHGVNGRGWHVFSRVWRGHPQILGSADLDALLDRVELRQAEFEDELRRFKNDRTPGVPVNTGLSHT